MLRADVVSQNGGGSVMGSWSQLITGAGRRVKLVSYSVTGPRAAEPGSGFGFALVGVGFALVGVGCTVVGVGCTVVGLGDVGVVARFVVLRCPEVEDSSAGPAQGSSTRLPVWVLQGFSARLPVSVLGVGGLSFHGALPSVRESADQLQGSPGVFCGDRVA